MTRRLLAALLAGGASVFAFAPFDLFPLAFLGLGVLAWLLGRALRAREAFALGFAWGFGAFIGGVSWLYVALERYGGMPAPLPALATTLFCAYLALYPPLPGAAFVSLQRRIVAADGENSRLQHALGKDWKGRLSPLLYISGVALSFANAHLAQLVYAAAALLWLIPDKRIERELRQAG